MPPPTSLVSRLKVQLKLSISRLRMTQQKDTAIVKQQRREMAQLLEQGKLESARIRVENIIRSEITTELHEILELYCELLLARSQLLDPPGGLGSPKAAKGEIAIDPGLEEAVRSIVYAAPRTEVRELHQSRALLVDKFGKDFALSCMDCEGVAERVLSKLKVETPSKELVDKYLRIIAEGYQIPFPEGLQPPEDGPPSNPPPDDDEPGSGGQKIKALEAAIEAENLSAATPPHNRPDISSPIRIAPQSPSTENPMPKLKLPGSDDKVGQKKERDKKAPAPPGKVPNADDDLLKRLAALKGA